MKKKIEIIPIRPNEFYILEDNVVSYIYCNNITPQFRIGEEIDPDKWYRTPLDRIMEYSDVPGGRNLQYKALYDLYSKDYPEYFI